MAEAVLEALVVVSLAGGADVLPAEVAMVPHYHDRTWWIGMTLDKDAPSILLVEAEAAAVLSLGSLLQVTKAHKLPCLLLELGSRF